MPKALLSLTLLLVGAALVACAPAVQAPRPEGGQSDGQPRVGGQLNIRQQADPYDWDMSYAGKSTPNDDGMAYAYNSLLTFEVPPKVKYAEMVLRPELAERWEVSPDAKTFTFHLRPGVRFANLPPVNGRELTSADVKWSYEYWTRTGQFKEKKLPQGQFDYFFEGMQAIDTPDKSTVVVRFNEAFVPFINYTASEWNPIVPKEIFDEAGNLKDKIAGTGPYQLDQAASQKGTRWVWKKNPNYWEPGKPYLDEIRWLTLPDESVTYAAFQTKQLDLVYNLAYNDYQEVRAKNPQAVEHKYVQPRGYHLYLSNAKGGPFTDLRVRRAAALAIDRDEINKLVAGAQGTWAVPGAMADLFTEAEAKQLQRQDLEAAKKLMAEAGLAGGVKLDWAILNDEDRANLSWFQLVQAQLKKAGFDVVFNPMDKVTQRQKKYTGDYDLDSGTGLGGLEADNDSMLYGPYHSSSSGNWSKVKDEELDKLLVAQRREPNAEKRRELLRNAAKRIVDQAWGIEIIYPPKWDLVHPYVKNYYTHFGNRARGAFAWFEK